MHSVAYLFLIFIAEQAYGRDFDYCFAQDNDPYLYMGTKTAYQFVHAGKTRFEDVPNCRAVQVWMLATHGTRCPSAAEVTRMVKLNATRDQIVHNHEVRGEGHLCPRDLEALRKWQPDEYLSIQRADFLTPQGVDDIKLLARRLQTNFPDLLQPKNGDEINPSDYKFRTTDADLSMQAFAEGLFGKRNAVTPEESFVNDTLLATYRTCKAWYPKRHEDHEEDNNDDNDEDDYEDDDIDELDAFDDGPEFQNLLHNVTRRLGYLYNLPEHSILTMYDMCRYEKAWKVHNLSPWCSVFSKEELRILEYREDLKYYYKAGYGREINAQLGCYLLQDMMNHFWKIEQQSEDSMEPKGIFYFSDIVSLQNLLTALKISQDEMPLTGSSYKNMAKRHWRTSFISPFTGNLVAVFYRCENTKQPNKVMFYLSEQLVKLDGCNVGLCDWEYLKKMLGRTMLRCSLDACKGDNAAAVSSVSGLLVALLAYLCLVALGQ